MVIERAEIFELSLPLRSPYETSSARYTRRGKAIVRLHTTLGVGHGENQANTLANYSDEVTAASTDALQRSILPRLIGERIDSVDDLARLLSDVDGMPMAKASVETAVWDVLSQRDGVPLYKALGGTRTLVAVGVSLGIDSSIDRVLEAVHDAQPKGYRRIKLKIRPGWDVDVVRAVRRSFPDIPVMVDANGAYQLTDLDKLRELDALGLLMIEQPLPSRSLADHAAIQRRLGTPICLDESVATVDDAREAIACGAARILNIKPARVGGLETAREICRLAEESGIGVWCGSLLEWGIGRAANLALAALPNFVYPNDIEPSDRFYAVDVVDPPVVVEDGCIAVPKKGGLGVSVDNEVLARFTVRRSVVGREGRRAL